MRSVVSVFSLAYPFVLREVLCALLHSEADGASKKYLFLLTVIIYTGRLVSKSVFNHAINRLATQVQGGLTALVFEKHQALTKVNAKNSASLDILRFDIKNISLGISEAVAALFSIVDAGFGVCFLSALIGSSALVLMLPLATSVACAFLFGNRLANARNLEKGSFSTRKERTASMLAQLPASKMIGLAPAASQHIAKLHAAELEEYTAYQLIRLVSDCSVTLSRIMTPAIIIAVVVFTKFSRSEAGATVIFPMLNLVSLHSKPLAALLHKYPNISNMMSSFYRVETFLALEERTDPRAVSTFVYNKGVKYDAVVASSSKTAGRSSRSRPTNFLRFSTVSIMPYETKLPVYMKVNFSLEPGSITAVVGTRRSGKTTFLEAMLGETKIRDGTAYVGDDIVGFAGQCVWLQDISVRDNVIGPHPFNIRRFKLVVRCCLLQDDLKTFPGGDCFVIGPGGSRLSNSQRNRLALARAVYADPSLLLLDDVFASLDRRTAASILFRLCGKDGLLKQSNCTVVFATSLAEIAEVADQFLLLNKPDRSVRFQLKDGQLQAAEFLRTQHVSALEVAEEKRRKAIHTTSRGLAKRTPRASTAVKLIKGHKRPVIRHLFRSMGFLGLSSCCCMVSFLSYGEILPGELGLDKYSHQKLTENQSCV